MRRMILLGVLALAGCGTSSDDASTGASNNAQIAVAADDALPDPEVSLSGATLDQVRALRSEDPAARLHAAQALGKSGNSAVAPALLRELSDKDSYARRAAAEALGCVLEKAPPDTAARNVAYKALAELLRDSDMSVRYQAVDAFSRLRERRAVPLLIKVLSGDSDESVRGHAAFALGEIADPAAFDALKDALKEDGNSWKVSYAIAALANNDDARAARFLLDALERKQYTMISGAGEFLATQSGADTDKRLIEMLQLTHEATLAMLLAKHRNPAVVAAANAVGVPEGMTYGRVGC